MNTDIKNNLEKVLSQIKDSVNKCDESNGRNVKLLAVSKFHPVEEIREAIECGQKYFGENRVQEAYQKFSVLKKEYPQIKLHIIGSLQTNKVKKACEIADCIQSVDRLSLIDEIEKQCAKLNKIMPVLFEIHTAEDSKSGFTDINELKEILKAISNGKYPHIKPEGLMTMAPFTEDEFLIRKSFSYLKELLFSLKKEFPKLNLSELSMGMSGDFKIAIQEGSTMVRIGTSIFGPRNY